MKGGVKGGADAALAERRSSRHQEREAALALEQGETEQEEEPGFLLTRRLP